MSSILLSGEVKVIASNKSTEVLHFISHKGCFTSISSLWVVLFDQLEPGHE